MSSRTDETPMLRLCGVDAINLDYTLELMSGGAATDIIEAACSLFGETTRRGVAYRLLSRIVRGGVQPPPARRRRLFAGPDMMTEGSLPLNDEDD